jgi:hypothetical protein
MKYALVFAIGLLLLPLVSADVIDLGNCTDLYWFDTEFRNCSVKLFCGAYTYYGLQTFTTLTECEAALNITTDPVESECTDLFWFDNENKSCGQKEFCGAYMYFGLRTFESKTECENVLNEANETEDNDEDDDNETEDDDETEDNETKEEKSNITFTPWQKRNESECVEGCKCVGAVMTCYTTTGKTMTITAGRSGNIITIIVDKSEVNTTLEIEVENNESNETTVKAKLSNGTRQNIKVMPETASLRARERLGELGFNITLKEVGKELVYEVDAEKEGKVFGLFRAKGKVQALVNAETGEVSVKKPWWAFTASGI